MRTFDVLSSFVKQGNNHLMKLLLFFSTFGENGPITLQDNKEIRQIVMAVRVIPHLMKEMRKPRLRFLNNASSKADRIHDRTFISLVTASVRDFQRTARENLQ